MVGATLRSVQRDIGDRFETFRRAPRVTVIVAFAVSPVLLALSDGRRERC